MPICCAELQSDLDLLDLETFQNAPPSCVALNIPARKAREIPEACETMDNEWNRLDSAPCWDKDAVAESVQVAQEAKEQGETIGFLDLMELFTLKGSELLPGHPRRYYKGRAVGRRDAVFNEGFEIAARLAI